MTIDNHFKQWITTGERRPLGTFLMSGSPTISELVAYCGYDFGLVDMEHSPLSISDTLAILRTLAGTPMQSVVRMPSHDSVIVKKVLDIGAQSLMFPFVESAEQAQALVASTRYPVNGYRGVAGVHRASHYGQIDSYFRRADDQVAVIAQLETPEAVDKLEEIAGVAGIDAVFIGPNDLAASMGCIGETENSETQHVIESAAQRASAIGKPIGIVGGHPNTVNWFLELGYTFVAVNSDLGMLGQRAVEFSKDVKNQN